MQILKVLSADVFEIFISDCCRHCNTTKASKSDFEIRTATCGSRFKQCETVHREDLWVLAHLLCSGGSTWYKHVSQTDKVKAICIFRQHRQLRRFGWTDPLIASIPPGLVATPIFRSVLSQVSLSVCEFWILVSAAVTQLPRCSLALSWSLEFYTNCWLCDMWVSGLVL